MAQTVIEINGLKKRFGTTEALRGISFEVPSGQVVGFLGPNGAGKTTTMRVLAGFLIPTEGRVSVAGIDVLTHSVEARRLIGYLPENNPLYEDMMVLEYLEFIAEARGVPSAKRRARIASAVERCGLTEMLGKDIGQLSKGFRQRVGLAQTIVHDPELLILDEPTTGLDPNQIVEIRSLIQQLGREKTVLLSSHILSEVQSTCSRVLIINDGLLVADDSPEHLSAGEGATVELVLASRNGAAFDAAAVRGWLTALPGVLRVEQGSAEGAGSLGFVLHCSAEDPRRALFEAVIKHEAVLLEVHRKHASLEDTFRKLTASESANGKAPRRAGVAA
jgi:ABC-2 type transport system ATP-binding protein